MEFMQSQLCHKEKGKSLVEIARNSCGNRESHEAACVQGKAMTDEIQLTNNFQQNINESPGFLVPVVLFLIASSNSISLILILCLYVYEKNVIGLILTSAITIPSRVTEGILAIESSQVNSGPEDHEGKASCRRICCWLHFVTVLFGLESLVRSGKVLLALMKYNKEQAIATCRNSGRYFLLEATVFCVPQIMVQVVLWTRTNNWASLRTIGSLLSLWTIISFAMFVTLVMTFYLPMYEENSSKHIPVKTPLFHTVKFLLIVCSAGSRLSVFICFGHIFGFYLIGVYGVHLLFTELWLFVELQVSSSKSCDYTEDFLKFAVGICYTLTYSDFKSNTHFKRYYVYLTFIFLENFFLIVSCLHVIHFDSEVAQATPFIYDVLVGYGTGFVISMILTTVLHAV